MRRPGQLGSVVLLLTLPLGGCGRGEPDSTLGDTAATESPQSDGTGGAAVLAGEAILAGAARWLGVDTFEPIETIRALASVDVRPNTKHFETLIVSARDRRARMHQSDGLHAGLHPQGAWIQAPGEDRTAPLPVAIQPVVQGHELHAMVLMPLTRYHEPTYRGETPYGSALALEVTVEDEWGGITSLFFTQQDTLPLGMRREGVVEVHITDWETQGALNLFRTATFDDTQNVYHYTYTTLTLNDVEDEEFLFSPTQVP